MSQPTCRLEILAAQPHCTVAVCDHGTVHLSIGSVTLRLGRASLDPLAEVLARAVAAARAEPTERESAVH